MAKTALGHLHPEIQSAVLVCPMIDARRQEVFTAVYNANMDIILPAQAHILSNDSFVATLLQNKMLFCGNGAAKFETFTEHANAMFAGVYNNSAALCHLSNVSFVNSNFTPLAYCEPLYIKEFYTG